VLRILGADGPVHFRSALLTHFVTDPTAYISTNICHNIDLCKERPLSSAISDWTDGDTGSFDAEMGSVASMVDGGIE